MMLDFPSSPSLGQQHPDPVIPGVPVWIWDGIKWTPSGLGSTLFLLRSGGVMDGPLTLDADPEEPLEAATKRYVDDFLPLIGGKLDGPLTLDGDPEEPLEAVTKRYVDDLPQTIGFNCIINGDMRIDQRNDGASGGEDVTNGFVVDRWWINQAIANHMTWGRNLNDIDGPPGFPYYLGVQSRTILPPGSFAMHMIFQQIEADMISDFAWGTEDAQPVTLSFWVNSSIVGSFSGAVRRTNRSYPFSFSVTTADTWIKISVTIPGDTDEEWVMSGNTSALIVVFDLGSGDIFRRPAGEWVSASPNGVIDATNIIGVMDATFYLTGVKLEVGRIATPFNRQSLTKSMMDCQRYYQTVTISARFPAWTSGQMINQSVQYPVPMRVTPTASLLTAGQQSNVGSFVLSSFALDAGRFEMASEAAAEVDTFSLMTVYALDAEF